MDSNIIYIIHNICERKGLLPAFIAYYAAITD